MVAVGRARAEHPRYSALQKETLALSVGGDPAGAARRGAEAIVHFLHAERAGR